MASSVKLDSEKPLPEAPIDYCCPVSGDGMIMGRPVQLTCCGKNIDEESINALLRRLLQASSDIELSCPLCRATHIVHDDSTTLSQSPGLVDRVEGVIRNSALQQIIMEWVNKNPSERAALLIGPEHFPPPSDEDEEAEPNQGMSNVGLAGLPRGLLEALEAASDSPQVRMTFGPGFYLEVPKDGRERERRDFITVFNAIWQEIDYDKRPDLLSDISYDETGYNLFLLQQKILLWLNSPDADRALSSIEVLYLQSSQLSKVSQQLLGKLRNLRTLDVSDNQLTQLPVAPRLHWLNARQNRIQVIAGHASGLRYLESLLLKGNPIVKIDPELARLERLEQLELYDISKDFKGIPLEFVAFKGTIYISKEFRRQWISTLSRQVNLLLRANSLAHSNPEAADLLEAKLSPYFRKMVLGTLETLRRTLSQSGLTLSPDYQKTQAYFDMTIYYIGWLYWQNESPLAEKLFSQLPLSFRNQVFGLVYSKAAPMAPDKAKADPEFGRKVFYGHNGFPGDMDLRIGALHQAGSERRMRITAGR